MRLEQRIGRVDRIGQTRRVHAVNLVAGGTAEEAILGRLVDRIARVREAIGHESDPIGQASRIAAAMIAPDTSVQDPVAQLCAKTWPRAGPAAWRDKTARPAQYLAAFALLEFERLQNVRRVLRPHSRSLDKHGGDLRSSFETTAPWALVVGRMDGLAPGVLCVFRMHLIDARGRLLEEMLLPVHAEARGPLPTVATARSRSETLLEIASMIMPALCARARSAAGSRLAALAPDVSASSRNARDREAAIARLVRQQFRPGVTSPVQAGLFDQRGLRQAAARRLAWARLHLEFEHQRASHEGSEVLSLAGEPEPMLVLWIAPAS
jgi:hypothetical protein